MVVWSWILVALLIINFVGFVICIHGMNKTNKEDRVRYEKIGYAKAAESMTGGIIDRLAEIQRTLLRIEGEVNDNQLGDVSGDGTIRNGD